MKISEFVGQLDWRSVRYHLSSLLQLLGVVLCAPAVGALLLAELRFGAILVGLAFATWLLGRLGRRGREPMLRVREAMVVTALAYLLFAAVGAVPFLLIGPPVDSFFESLSGFTTTGLSIFGVDLPRSLLLFRAYMQWVGGAGIVVLSLVLLSHTSRPMPASPASPPGQESLVGSFLATARVTMGVYLALTAAALLVVSLAGMSFFDALVHAFSSVSTGGFSSAGGSLGSFRAQVGLAMIPVMIAGGTSFTLFHATGRRGLAALLRDEQLQGLVALVVVGGLLMMALGDGAVSPISDFFHAASAVTTTGYRVTDPSTWSPGERMVMISLMVVGGSSGSTSGGVKVFRLLVLIQLARWLVARTLLPREARLAVKFRGSAIEEDDLRRILGFVVLYGGILVLSTFVLSVSGVGPPDAAFESASALGTVGLSVGVTGADLSPWAKLVLCFDMWAGRLEIVPVLVLLHRSTWWSRGTRAG